MKALHTLWSEPSFAGREYFMEDFEMLTMIISAMTWKKYNGNIKLIADKKILEYFEEKNLLFIYDETEELKVRCQVNPKTFWAAGKLFALQQETEPCAVIDMDFIAWKNIDKFTENCDVTVAHRENFTSVYPNLEYFKMNPKYRFNSGLDWQAYPCNTAFLYIKDSLFKDFYLSESVNFMRNCIETENDICSMVFAEQRLLSACASQWGMTVGTLMKEEEFNIQRSFTHIWGYKRVLRDDALKRYEFCMRCARRIKNDFPEITEILLEVPQISDYFLKVYSLKS